MVTHDQVMDAVLTHMRGPFVWGASDCCTSASDVFQALHGVDPMAPLRGQYTTEAGAWALVRLWGGWRRMTTRLAAQAGCHAGVGAAGEVGLLRLPDRFVLGIGLGHEQWAGRIDGGFASTDRVVLCFGSVQHA